MPALRERGDDILMIARYFLEEYNEREGKTFGGFSAEAEDVLRRYPWPGNVRQLQNTVQQAVVLNSAHVVDATMLPEQLSSGHLQAEDTVTTKENPAANVATLMSHVERRQ